MDVRKTVEIVSANLGSFDKAFPGQITDREFPPRSKSMTPRLQARIVKMHMWEFAAPADYYLWVDSSCVLTPGGEDWFLEQLGDADIAVFKHPHRETVLEEAEYLEYRLAIKCPYITPRYKNEDISGQLDAVNPSAQLFASTAFIMRDTPEVRAAMREWWYHTSRYHSIDQLSLPYVIKDLRVKVMLENYLKIPHLTYVRNKP